MASVNLSAHDVNVLEKIKDPEANPTNGVITDTTLPRDPHLVDDAVYDSVVADERTIIQVIQGLETKLINTQTDEDAEATITAYKACALGFDDLISKHPNYASARNNRAQLARRLYGDAMLFSLTQNMPMPLITQPERVERLKSSATALEDLDHCISLLSPANFRTPISPQAARTLSMAHTQRAAIYLKTSKLLAHRELDVMPDRKECKWSKLDFEEAAARDLAFGGRYGNQIAKELFVSVNPTAKLCGQIVREAMKKEYGPSFSE